MLKIEFAKGGPGQTGAALSSVKASVHKFVDHKAVYQGRKCCSLGLRGQTDGFNDALVCPVDDVAADGVEIDARCLLAGVSHALADDADGNVQVACNGGP